VRYAKRRGTIRKISDAQTRGGDETRKRNTIHVGGENEHI